MKIMKSKILLVILSAIIFTSIGALATVAASNITYNNTTVDLALDDLYNKVNDLSPLTNDICTYVSEGSYGQKGEVGALYDCEVGPNIHKNFYILTIRDKEVDLIMDRDVTMGTSYKALNWRDAMNYFRKSSVANGEGVSIKNTWTNVLKIDLPSAQAILDVVKPSYTATNMTTANWFCFKSGGQDYGAEQNYCAQTATYQYSWLFNHNRGCTNYGCDEAGSGSTSVYSYWTKDIAIGSSPIQAWMITNIGSFMSADITDTTNYGVRPVITVLKAQLKD